MATARGPAPTRWNLLRTRRRLDRVEKGAELLGRKRRALVTELFGLARPALEDRARLLERATSAYPALLRALSARGSGEIRALGWPSRDPEIDVELRETWGVRVAEVRSDRGMRRTPQARGVAPAGTGPSASEAADAFEDFVTLLLEAASRETQIRRLARAVARTSRQVNTLEQRVGPALAHQVAEIRRTLEERERDDHLRLRRLGRKRGGASDISTGRAPPAGTPHA